MGKVGPTPKGRQTIRFALDMVLGLGELGGERSPPPLPFLCPDPDAGVHRFYFFPRAPAKNPTPLFECPCAVVF